MTQLDYRLLTQVTPADEVIGPVEVLEAHRQLVLHRAISVYLFNSQGELLMQQRSAHKIVGAHMWANTVCGNVAFGEDYLTCALRRLDQELGLTFEVGSISALHDFQYQVQCNQEYGEHEIVRIFAGRYSGTSKPNPAEVQATRWVSLEDLKAAIQSQKTQSAFLADMQFAPWMVLALQNQQVVLQLQQYLKNV